MTAIETETQSGKTSGSFDDLKQEVDSNAHIMAVPMERLRNAAGKGRLGKWVVQEISNQLRSRGLGHTELSVDNQWKVVFVYTMGSEVERIIEAVHSPSDAGAQTLRTVTSDSSADVLTQIKALVESV
jgi:hypothetical protein